MPLIANAIAICFYLLASGYQGKYLLNTSSTKPPRRNLLLGMSTIAVIAHAISIIVTIYSKQQLDLGVFRVSSLIFLVITTLSLLNLLRRPSTVMLTFLFPLAALSIFASSVSTPVHSLQNHISSGLLTHILISVFAYSVLTIAAIQACILALQIRALKHHHTLGIIKAMPPLQTMEVILFETLWAGLILLTISLISGAIFIDDIFAQHLAHKTILSIIAWFIFATLLWGRHQLGWRSLIAVKWTISGFVFLMLSYFGSKFVLELILIP
jgi:ABC-type uncharacterized transport system permease subunit